MRIEKLKSEDVSRYDELALSHGTIFNTTRWTRMFGDSAIPYGIYQGTDELIGGCVLYEERRFGLSIFRDPPFTPAIGPFIRTDATNPVSVMDTWKKAMTQLADLLEGLPYAVISLSFNPGVIDALPFIWNKFKVSPGYTYLLDLAVPVDALWRGMSSERRKNINKGIKDGLEVKRVVNQDTVKGLVRKTFSRQEKKINHRYLEKILFEFSDNDNSFAFATYHREEAIACSFCVCDSQTAYYLLGGYNHENKHHGAGALSLWEAIKHAKAVGLKSFDFEGSMVPQIERFFREFGGKITPFYRISKAWLPFEILLKFYKRELF